MYLDLLILINLVVNYFLLLLTAKLFRRNPGIRRLLTGAALGALAVLAINLPYPALNVILTLGIPFIMILAVFWPLGWVELFFL